MKLSNSHISLTFDDKTGSLNQIENRRTDRKFLNDPKGARLFRICVPEEQWLARFCDSHDSKATLTKNENEVRIAYANLLAGGKRTGISATVRVSLPPDSLEASFTLELQNNGPDVIEQVRFAWLGGWTGIAGAGKDTLTIASECRDPHSMFPKTLSTNVLMRKPYKHFDVFPAHLFLPWLDISGNGEGLSYICYMEEPVVAGIVTEHLRPYDDAGLCLGWSWVNDPFIKPGRTWRSARIGIGIHDADWHATSDRYRDWLTSWYKPAAATRRLKQSIGFQNVMFRSWDRTEYNRFKDLPRIAKESIAYGVTDICIWDEITDLYVRDNGGELLEDTPERRRELQAALAKAEKLGCNVSMILNFRLMRSSSKPFPEYGEELAIRRHNDSPYMEGYSMCSSHAAVAHGPSYRHGSTYVLCQTPERAAERALNLVRQGLELGLVSVFVDQANEWQCCLSDRHGHKSPDDTPQGPPRWVKQARKLVKEQNDEGYLIGEELDVFSSENIELGWHWFWKDKNPEVFRYCLPESLQTWVVDCDIAEINVAFVMGFYFAIISHGMEKTLRDNPVAAAHIEKLTKLRRASAESTVMAQFRDDIGLHVKNGFAKIYLSDTTLAVIVADTTGHACRANLLLDPQALGIAVQRRGGLIYSTDHAGSKPAHSRPANNRIRLNVELDPFEVRVCTFPLAE